MLIKDIIHGIGVPFYSYNGSVKQQTYQLKLTLSSINMAASFSTAETSLLFTTSGIRAAAENPQRISTAKDGSGSNRYRVRSANSQTKNEHGCSFFCDGIHAAAAINAQRSICTISYNKLIE